MSEAPSKGTPLRRSKQGISRELPQEQGFSLMQSLEVLDHRPLRQKFMSAASDVEATGSFSGSSSAVEGTIGEAVLPDATAQTLDVERAKRASLLSDEGPVVEQPTAVKPSQSPAEGVTNGKGRSDQRSLSLPGKTSPKDPTRRITLPALSSAIDEPEPLPIIVGRSPPTSPKTEGAQAAQATGAGIAAAAAAGAGTATAVAAATATAPHAPNAPSRGSRRNSPTNERPTQGRPLPARPLSQASARGHYAAASPRPPGHPGGWNSTRGPSKETELSHVDPPMPLRKALGLKNRPSSRAGKVSAEAMRQYQALTQAPQTEAATAEAPRPSSRVGDSETVELGMRQVAELVSWVRPAKTIANSHVNTLSRLVAEINEFAKESSAYLGGRCDRQSSLQASAGEARPPLDPWHTAQGMSLLFRVIRCLPNHLPMRGILSTLVLELLEAIYYDMPTIASLDELKQEWEDPAVWYAYSPWYTVVTGHTSKTKSAQERAERAERAAAEEKAKGAPRAQQLRTEEMKNAALREELAREKELHEATKAALAEEQLAHTRFKDQTKCALSNFSEMEMRDQQSRADMRQLERLLKEKSIKNEELEKQSTTLTSHLQEKERALADLEIVLQRTENETKDIGYMRTRLAELEGQEGKHGVDFAKRLAAEVLGTTLEELVEKSQNTAFGATMTRGGSMKKEARLQKHTLDIVTAKFRTMPTEIRDLRAKVERLTQELQETRTLIPEYNLDAAEDLVDAFDEDAPIHHEIFSMKDKRSFLGLGLGQNVPPYLRAEGLVKHVFFTKGELERLMRSFQSYLFQEDSIPGVGSALSPEQLHHELHLFMMKTLEDTPAQSLPELGYAFICGLEAYRDDPDFELFDLILCGAVHPSIMQDANNMLRELQSLILRCQGSTAVAAALDRSHGSRQSTASVGMHQVSRRMIRAVLRTIFPEKKGARHNALRRALAETMQHFADLGKSADPDTVYISDLFSSSADGEQCKLIEEIRRQHYYEVIEFTKDLTTRLREGSDYSGIFQASKFKRVYHDLDPSVKQPDLDRMYEIAFAHHEGEGAYYADILRNLRHSVLLKAERQWIRADPRDVVEKMSIAPPKELLQLRGMLSKSSSGAPQAEAAQAHASEDSSGEAPVKELLVQPIRMQGAKVLTNPLAKLRSDIYSTPEGLQHAVLPSSADVLESTDMEGEEDN